MEAVLLLALTCPVSQFDCCNFPCQECCVEYISGAERHCDWLERRAKIDPRRRDYWLEQREEAGELLKAWNHLVMAHSFRRQNMPQSCEFELEQLRDLIGEEAYNARRMPPPLPVWRFATVK